MCEICSSAERDGSMICVVEEPLDVLALERSSGFQGRYHVLHGVLSPIEGIGPEDLKIVELLKRLQGGGVQEVILATNPEYGGRCHCHVPEGANLDAWGCASTRLARGLPVGGDLEYADPNTLLRALAGRQETEL